MSPETSPGSGIECQTEMDKEGELEDGMRWVKSGEQRLKGVSNSLPQETAALDEEALVLPLR